MERKYIIINQILTFLLIFSLLIISTPIVESQQHPEVILNYTHPSGTRANDSENYTQMALNFIRENYPNNTLRILTLYEEHIPFPETGYVYTDIKVEITPGENSPSDSVIVTIRHDTLKIEFGDSQYQRDYDDYYNLLPPYYKKMWQDFRVMIKEKLGYLPIISDSVSESYITNFTIYYTPYNQTEVVKYLQNEHLNYSIVKVPYDNNSYIVSDMSLKNCLLVANQSYVQGVGINVLVNWELYVIDSWNDSSNFIYKTEVLIGIGTIVIIVSVLLFYYVKKRKHLKS